MRRPGLRTRVTAGFALGAMAVSVAMALLSYQLTQRFLLQERERTAVRATIIDAGIVSTGLAADQPDVNGVLRTLDTGGKRHALLLRGGQWFSRSDDGLSKLVPAGLISQVQAGNDSVQRIRTPAGPALVIGMHLTDDTQFYVVDSMQELDRSLQVLALVLTLTAGITTVGGGLLGAYAARKVVRPLRSVTSAARDITGGDFTARLNPATEPDLADLTAAFNQMVDDLSRRIERDRRFAADVSHELRSPLQTLSASASVLVRRRDQMDSKAAAAAGLIGEEIERFQVLVTDLLELARSDQPADRAPVDVADLTRRLCQGRNLPTDVLAVDTGTDPVWRVDRRRFEQILTNLLDNADRHGGGVIAVRLAGQDGRHVIEVDDEGPGISPPDRDVIFDRFVRGRTASARGTGDGAGLGLSLVAQHVAAHGGRVLVTDRPGGGARFRIEIPEAGR